ncbi:transmembrane protein 220-like isoform X1 [Montipora foliosa]|uniref:transmembrane protein 220-like isoform X1 n=1 Tax=Montipora foliosa TaxID=591990 RepID=UPI0035F0FEF4
MSRKEEMSSMPDDKNISRVCNPWTWRLANGVMATFFALSAYVQINDPDPLIWMLIYGIPCVLCCALVIDLSLQDTTVWKWTAIVHLCVCILGILYSVSVLLGNNIDSKNPLKSEEGREIGGLMIVVLWLGLCQVTRLKSFKETAVYLWTVTIAISVVPFVLWAFYLATWDMSSVKNHCKGIISRHLYKQDI